jgi:hypothetical protein
MSFSINLILPERGSQEVQHVDLTDLDEFLDDDPSLPLDLTRACRALQGNEVKFRITGFFGEPIRLDAGGDLSCFLEALPRLLAFVENESLLEFTLGMWVQNTETEFFFERQPHGNEIRVTFHSSIKREIVRTTETTSKSEMGQQLRQFVANYLLAVERFYPQFSDHPWNKKLTQLIDPFY